MFLSQQPELRRAQLPQPCGQQSANMKEAQNPLCCSFRLSGCTLSQSYLYDLFSLFIHSVRLRPQWTSWETFLSLAEEVCRHRCGLSEWHWSSLTSCWWLVLLLLLRGLPLSQCTTTQPWPQYASKEGSIEDKNTGWHFLFLYSILLHLF